MQKRASRVFDSLQESTRRVPQFMTATKYSLSLLRPACVRP